MNKLVIPSILAATVLVAAAFAIMPIEKASTVHTTIQANTARIVNADSADSTATDQDIRITCPTDSNGCQILEIYVEERTGANAVFTQIDGVIAGDTISPLVDNADVTVNNSRAVIGEAGGIGMGAGDTITLVTDDATTADTARYNVSVVAFVQGGTTVSVSFV